MENNLHQLNAKNTKEFIVAGNATVTLESSKTGARFTYRVKKLKDSDVWFVSLLTGPDNDGDYNYIGYFNKDLAFKTSAKSKIGVDAPSFKAFQFLMLRINNIPEALKVYHSCKCGRCGRTLTTPESIERGLGPECCKMQYQ